MSKRFLSPSPPPHSWRRYLISNSILRTLSSLYLLGTSYCFLEFHKIISSDHYNTSNFGLPSSHDLAGDTGATATSEWIIADENTSSSNGSNYRGSAHLFNSTPSEGSTEPFLTEEFLADIHQSIGDIVDSGSARLDCGEHKCFVPSSKNESIGYLIENNVTNLPKLLEGFKVAKWIEKAYGGKHLYLNAPFQSMLDEETYEQINKVAYFTLKEESHQKFLNSPLVAVQKTKKAPIKDSLFVGCFGSNAKRFEREIEGFAKKVCTNGSSDKFMNNSLVSHGVAKKVFKNNPILLHDFQALFDANGHLYFIDLDGHLRYTPWGWSRKHIHQAEKCLEKIARVSMRVKELKRKGCAS